MMILSGFPLLNGSGLGREAHAYLVHSTGFGCIRTGIAFIVYLLQGFGCRTIFTIARKPLFTSLLGKSSRKRFDSLS